MKKQYAVQIYWEVCGTVFVDAETPEQAREIALSDEKPLPTSSDYVTDSVNCDIDCDVQEIVAR
jgi:hypothetical protein